MRTTFIFAATLVFTVSPICESSAQTQDQWIYTDSLEVPWEDWSWSTTRTFNSTEQTYSGSYSIKAVQSAWGGLQLHSGGGGTPVDVDPADYTHLEFAIYMVSSGHSMAVNVENDGGSASPLYYIENLPLNQWVLVAIPMADINPGDITFHKVIITNQTGSSKTYYVDAIRLLGQPQPNTAPPTPTLISPLASATGVSKRPTFNWQSSSGTETYRLQVSEASDFSSTVFDDSTITLTWNRVFGLENSTAYYWRVRAKNSSGTSSYSSTRQFTTVEQNTEDSWVYQDTMIAPWAPVSGWNTTVTVQQTSNVHSGTYSMKVQSGGWGYIGIRAGASGPPVEIDATDYDSLSFFLYTGPQSLTINVFIYNDDNGATSGITYTNLPSNQWRQISISMEDLNPNNWDIHHIKITNNTASSVTYYIDDMRLMGHPEPAAPSGPPSPLLASPPDSSVNQSLFTVLKWFQPDTTTLDYQLQVSENSNFSSFVFNDSTLTDTTRLMTNLEADTKYYWRVSARDIEARGPWSEIWDFTTKVDTVDNLTIASLDSTIPFVMLSEATKFLYSGAQRVQYGVDTTALDAFCGAVIRGRVVEPDTAALPGVKVSIVGHPEFGYTFSRADGMFDMVVNGAADYTLSYEKDGYFSSHRDVKMTCGSFSYADTVGLIRPDSAATVIRFEEPMEIALSSVVQDADGTRRIALAFEQGTVVTRMFPDSSTDVLSQITVRATEYTVGIGGPNAMPALLPPTSGYTYAANLTADEGLATGAIEIRFSKCPKFYVDNFIGFPVGMKVPVGYYRFLERRWVPLEDGRVIQIVDTAGGIATIALDSAGTASHPDSVEEFGITDTERQYLAALYAPGDEIMRTCVDYFGQYDKNCGIIAPEGATFANAPEPDDELFDLKYPSAEPSASVRSATNIMNQAMERDVPITGAPFSLHYTSEFQEGRKAELFIDVSSDSIPTGLKRIAVEITVAGQLTKAIIPALPNQTYHFIWNGKDAYGRKLKGEHDVAIRIGYVYNGQYQLPNYIRNNFALMSGTRIPLIQAREEITLWQKMATKIEVVDSKNLNVAGWIPSTLNALNPHTETVYFGNGQKKRLSTIGNGVQVVSTQDPGGWLNNGGFIGFHSIRNAPDGSLYLVRRQGQFSQSYSILRIAPNGAVTRIAGAGSSQADSIHISTAQISGVADLDIDAQGNIYFVNDSRIRKIDVDGIVTNIAGSTAGFSGDNGPATKAMLNSPQRLAVAPNGEIYVSDSFNGRIRKIGQDGFISTVAGGGSSGFTDGMIATQLAVSNPAAIAVGHDGNVYYVANNGFSRPGLSLVSVFRLGNDGRVYHHAGVRANQASTHPGTMPDGTIAKLADIGRISYLSIGRDGVLYIVCGNASGIHTRWTYNIDGEGKIRSVIGGGRFGFADFIGKPPREVSIEPSSLTFGAYGTAYFFHVSVSPLYQVAPATLALVDGKYELSSNDGGQVFVFDASGRHILTKDAITGRMIFTYLYDETGRLSEIMDRDSLVSTIERNASGTITAIISPKSERTEIGVDSTGMLASITNPNDETTQFQYSEGGLLSSVLLAGGGEQAMEYDSTGRLISASTAETPAMQLLRTQAENGYQVNATSPTGMTSSMNVQQFTTGLQRITATDPTGRTTYASMNPEGIDTLKTPDGTVIIQERTYDPRFGANVAIPGKTTTRTPGGLVSVEEQTRQITASSGTTPVEITDRTIINSRTFTRVYNNNTKLQTNTSSENRKTFTTFNSIDLPVKDSTGGILGTSYTYDSEGRVTSMTQGTRVTTYTYDATGRLQTTMDPTGRTDSLYYDETGRVIRQVFHDGREVLYEYDSNGNLTGITPPGKPEHRFTYDGDNRPLSYTPPIVPVDSLTPTFYEYDDEGRLKKTTFADSTFIEVVYDTVDGKQRSVVFERGTTIFDYDSTSGNLVRIIGVDDDTLRYTYDGSLPIDEIWIGEVNGRFTVKYDNSFRVVQEKVNGVDSIAIVYDKDDLPTRVGALALRYNTTNGLLLSDTVGSVITDYSYSSFGELTGIKARKGTDTLFNASYTRDLLGRITSLQEKVQGVQNIFAYSYDPAGRLEEVYRNDTLISSYSYDSNGNRMAHATPAGVDSASYDSQDRLVSYGGKTYVHTPNGYLKFKIENADTTSFTYDNYGNLVSVRLPDGIWVQYVIDAANRRIGKKIDSVTVQKFLYSGDLRIVAELDSANQIATRYVYASRENVPEYMVRGWTMYRFVLDHLGSVRLVINASTGDIAQRLDYDEFGRVFFDSSPGFQPFGYAGGLYDTVAALVRFGARDYDAPSGRWITQDPLGFSSGELNLYSYVRGDPVNAIDPVGTFGGTGELLSITSTNMMAQQRPSEAERAYQTAGDILEAIGALAQWDPLGAIVGAVQAIPGALATRGTPPGGVYAFVTESGQKYIGQSSNIFRRLKQHFGPGGKFSGDKLKDGYFVQIAGDKTIRERYEDALIRKLATASKLANEKFPIGNLRSFLRLKW